MTDMENMTIKMKDRPKVMLKIWLELDDIFNKWTDADFRKRQRTIKGGQTFHRFYSTNISSSNRISNNAKNRLVHSSELIIRVEMQWISATRTFPSDLLGYVCIYWFIAFPSSSL